MRHALLFLMTCWVLGCTEPSRDTRDGGVNVPDCKLEPEDGLCDAASAENVMFTWADSVCDFLLGCCTEGDRTRTLAGAVGADALSLLLLREPALATDHAACQRAVALTLFTEHQQNYQSWDDGRQGFDREAARACLAQVALGAQRCAPGLVLAGGEHRAEGCRALFTPLVAPAGVCTSDEDCLDAPDGGRSVCQSSSERRDDGGIFFSLTGACRPLPGLGDPCPLPDGDCGTGAFCAADETCHARGTIGELCIAAPCDEQGYCDTAAQPLATCVPRQPNFGPCLHDAQCVETAACHPTLLVCLERLDPDPLDVEFAFCLGDGGGVSVARPLVSDAGP